MFSFVFNFAILRKGQPQEERGVAELGDVLFVCTFGWFKTIFCCAGGHDPRDRADHKNLRKWGSFSGLLHGFVMKVPKPLNR